MKKIAVIIGPTASGKSNLALNLASALKSEIISLDSMQIYKHLDIGTAKVSRAERQLIKHHFIDLLAPTQTYSIADFLSDYKQLTHELKSKDTNFILAGGSLQYFLALYRDDDYSLSIQQDSVYRLQLQQEYQAYAQENSDNKHNPVYLKLCALDPERASMLHPNDMKRIIRALEICQSGSKASQQDPRRLEVKSNEKYAIFAYDWDRTKLYQRINERVDMMLKEGLLDEAKWVFNKQAELSNNCLQAIAYKEFFPYFKGEGSLETAVTQLKLNSRHYAKRQLSIMRKLPVNYLDPASDMNYQISTILQILAQ